jgi:MFS transporter, PPP family, 3-phenylpropionic acid transporter
MEQARAHRSLSVLKWFTFTSYGTMAILFTFFPLYFASQGLSKIQIGMLMAGGPFISIFANPFWGYLSDKYQNIRRTIVALIIGSFITVQAVFQLENYAALLAIMLAFFFFQSPLNSQGNSLILNAIEGTRHKFGSFRMWGSLGYAAVAVAAGPVLHAIGMERIWIAYSFLLLTALACTIGLPRGNLTAVSSVFSNRGYASVFKNRTFLIFVLLGVLISVPNSMNSTFIAIYIRELGGTEVAVGWSAFMAAVFEVAVFLLLDRIVKREVRFMIAGLALVSVLFSLRWTLMSLATEPIHILLIQSLHCVTFGGYFYLGTTLTSLLVPSEYRASGQAAFALTWGGISGIMAGFAGGWLYETLGAVMMYRVNAILALCGVAGFALVLKLAGKEQDKRAAVEAQG